MEVKTAERQFTIAGHPLLDFKIDEEREHVTGKAGKYEASVRWDGTAVVSWNRKNRELIAEYHNERFWLMVFEDKERWAWPVTPMDGEPRFSRLSLIDEQLFRKSGKKNSSPLTLEGVKDVLKLYEKGELKLAEKGEEELEKQRLGSLRKILRYEEEIREACKLLPEVKKLRTHPEVLKLMNEKGVLDKPMPVLTEEKAQVLSAIDSITKSGESATPRGILEWLRKQSGVTSRHVSIEDVIKMGILLGEVGSDGYVEVTKGGRVLTDLGRKELEKYRERTKYYVA